MTIDKIIHYIGKEQTEFILNQPIEKIKEMKKSLLYEFNQVHPVVKIPNDILFKYTIELELINRILKNQ